MQFTRGQGPCRRGWLPHRPFELKLSGLVCLVALTSLLAVMACSKDAPAPTPPATATVPVDTPTHG